MTGAQLVVFPFLLLVLPLVAATAWWLKHRYTAAIVRLQAQTNAASRPQDDRGVTIAEARSDHDLPARLQLDIQSARHVAPSTSVDAPRRLRRQVLLVHFASELLYWSALLVFATVVFASPSMAPRVLALVGPRLLPFLFVPSAIAWALQSGVQRRLMNVAAATILVTGLALLLSAGGWESELGFSFGYSSIALMISAFLRPSVRGAGLPLITAAIAGWIALSMLFAIGLALEGSSDDAAESFAQVAIGVLELLFMLAVAAWCAWRALIALASRYAAKRFSDVQLSLGAYWALMTAFMLGSVLKEQNPFEVRRLTLESACLVIVSLWLLWRWLQSMALRRVARTAGASQGALLFLRVFKPSGRSEEFTDRFFAYWRFAAPVWMIAGPDLAGAYMEPNEFFAYVNGRLREHFVADPSEATRRVEALDSIRDPDGRFRVNEMYCTDDTWRPTVLAMMARAGAILLDLREYSRQRRGTRYELTELLRRATLNRVLVLVNAKDDMTSFATEIDTIWQEVSGSRRDATGTQTLHVLQFQNGSNAEMHGLFRAAVRAAVAEASL